MSNNVLDLDLSNWESNQSVILTGGSTCTDDAELELRVVHYATFYVVQVLFKGYMSDANEIGRIGVFDSKEDALKMCDLISNIVAYVEIANQANSP